MLRGKRKKGVSLYRFRRKGGEGFGEEEGEKGGGRERKKGAQLTVSRISPTNRERGGKKRKKGFPFAARFARSAGKKRGGGKVLTSLTSKPPEVLRALGGRE